MGTIASVKSVTHTERNGAKVTDIKADPGGGANITAQHFSGPGDDSQPLPGDYVASIENQRSGTYSAVGFVDPKNAQTSGPGEKRIYARNAAGEAVATAHLKSTSEIVIFNANGSLALDAAGTWTINGVVTIDKDGNITTPGTIQAAIGKFINSLLAAGKELVAHIHPAGTPPGNTGPNS